jgi:hypothetical protein
VLAVSADQHLINKFAAELTGEAEHQPEKWEECGELGKRVPLRVVQGDDE